MLKKMLLLLTSCLITLPSPGSAAEATIHGAKAILAESVHEFQPVVEGTRVTHDFILGNQGDDTLEILGIRSG